MSIVPFSENGGFTGTNFFFMMPIQTSDLGLVFVGIFDTTSFDDPADSSFYAYRMEDVQPGRVPTVRRVILVYRDIGPCSYTITVSGTNDNGTSINATTNVTLGTTSASGALLTKFVDITLTAFRPQLSYSRAAGSGPVSIVSATMIGEVEEVAL